MDGSKEKKAIALVYDFQKDKAPVVLAKGEKKEAELIEEIANQFSIPIIENQQLADALYQLPVLAEIPEELYEAVALIYLQLSQLNENY